MWRDLLSANFVQEGANPIPQKERLQDVQTIRLIEGELDAADHVVAVGPLRVGAGGGADTSRRRTLPIRSRDRGGAQVQRHALRLRERVQGLQKPRRDFEGADPVNGGVMSRGAGQKKRLSRQRVRLALTGLESGAVVQQLAAPAEAASAAAGIQGMSVGREPLAECLTVPGRLRHGKGFAVLHDHPRGVHAKISPVPAARRV